MAKTKLVPGFRFHPTDVELVQYFLKRKVMGKKFPGDVIAEVDIYKYAPWDLPDKSCLKDGDLEWYFFCPRAKKYASGAKMNRATEVGYWKTTGQDRTVQYRNQIVGKIKTLVFHTGKAPRGDRTDWVMHEFRLEDKDLTDKGIPQDCYVICKVFRKEGPGPRNGAQYGKPFNEEDWDDEEVGTDCVESVPFADMSAPLSAPSLPMKCNSSVPNDTHLPASDCTGSTSMSALMPSPCPANPSYSSNQTIFDDDILYMLDSFKEIEKVDNAEGTPCLNSSDIFEGLGDPDNWAGVAEDGHGFSFGQEAEYTTNQVVNGGDVEGFGDLDFLELTDLTYPLFWKTTQPKS